MGTYRPGGRTREKRPAPERARIRVSASQLLAVAAALCLGLLQPNAAEPSPGTRPVLTRREFARRLKSIVASLHPLTPESDPNQQFEGMPAAQVQRLLGPPERVWTEAAGEEDGPWDHWLYGLAPGSAYATLGEVVLNQRGRASALRGAWGSLPPGAFGISEAHLRELLFAIEQIADPEVEPQNWDPGAVIRAVNQLHPLGRKRALMVLQEHVRVSRDQSTPEFATPAANTHWVVLDLLFPGVEHRVWGGMRYPVVLHRDVPYLFQSIHLSGNVGAKFGAADLEPYRQARLRSKPLAPGDDPHRHLPHSAGKLRRDPGVNAELTAAIQVQCLRLLNPVRGEYRMGERWFPSNYDRFWPRQQFSHRNDHAVDDDTIQAVHQQFSRLRSYTFGWDGRGLRYRPRWNARPEEQAPRR